MRIRTITCHCPHNFGAVLQAYALQNYLEKLGHDVKIIDYRPEYLTKSHSLSYVGNRRMNSNVFLRMLYILLFLIPRLKRTYYYKKFEEKYFRLTDKTYYSYNDLQASVPPSDLYICGSDQIWNTNLPNGNDESYYLSFVLDNSKKASYAASMSITDIGKEEREKIIKRIKDFRSISVREDSAKSILSSILSQDVSHVLDPVFLLSVEEWLNMASTYRMKINEKYILLYIMGSEPDEILQLATRMAKEKGLKIYLITNSLKKRSVVDKYFRGESPLVFLNLIKNAEFIITNSFHGTAFSIILNKQFVSCDIKNTNTRILSLLNLLRLKDRFCSDTNLPDSEINYIEVNTLLNIEIDFSKNYLTSTINSISYE